MLRNYEPMMKVIIDDPGYYRLYLPINKPFIAVAVQKKHVGIYCWPVFRDRSLLGPLSNSLVGKGTIGISDEDDPMIDEVPSLFERCFEYCLENGMIDLE